MTQNAFFIARNKKLGEKVVSSLKKRYFDAYYVDTKEQALETAINLIHPEDVVAWGGSMSITEIGLLDFVLKNKYRVYNRDIAKTPQERTEILRKSLLCDTVLTSSARAKKRFNSSRHFSLLPIFIYVCALFSHAITL